MGHALSIDTGHCEIHGGKTSMFAIDKDFDSTFWAAQFFGILKPQYSIMRQATVTPQSTELTYFVPLRVG